MTTLYQYQFFLKLIDENKKCIDLKEIEKFIDQRGFLNKTENYKLERKNTFHTEYKFYYAIEKNRSIFIYSPYQQLTGKGLRFKYECDLNTIKLSKDSKTIIKVLEQKKELFDLRSVYHDLNAYFILY